MLAWKGEGIRLTDFRERVELLQDDVESGLTVAEDYLAVAETDAQRRVARAQFDALSMIRSVVIFELQELGLRL